MKHCALNIQPCYLLCWVMFLWDVPWYEWSPTYFMVQPCSLRPVANVEADKTSPSMEEKWWPAEFIPKLKYWTIDKQWCFGFSSSVSCTFYTRNVFWLLLLYVFIIIIIIIIITHHIGGMISPVEYQYKCKLKVYHVFHKNAYLLCRDIFKWSSVELIEDCCHSDVMISKHFDWTIYHCHI